MYLITAYFDRNTSGHLSNLMENMSAVCKNDFMVANEIPPHMTLLQFHSNAEQTKIIELFREVEIDHENILSFSGYGTMIPKVACLAVEKTEVLLNLVSRFHEKMKNLPETIFNSHYVPSNFFPHVSIAKHLTDEQRNKAMLYLAEQKNPPAGRIAAISLTVGKPPHELFRLEC